MEERKYTVGLDVGTAFVVSMYVEEGGQVQQACTREIRNAFLEVDEALKVPPKIREKVVELGGKKFVLGKQAFKLGALLGKEVRRPLHRGVLSPFEPEAASVLGVMIRSVLPDGMMRGSRVVFSVPAPAHDDPEFSVGYHRDVILRLLERYGAEAESLTEGLAACYGSGVSEDAVVTVSIGAGMCNVAVTYEMFPVDEFSIRRGGDWLDEHAAQWLGKSKEQCAVRKEDPRFDLYGEDQYELAYRSAYKELLTYLYDALHNRLKGGALSEAGEKLVLQFVGGSVMPNRFVDLAASVLREHPFNPMVDDVRTVSKPNLAVARGLLYYAM